MDNFDKIGTIIEEGVSGIKFQELRDFLRKYGSAVYSTRRNSDGRPASNKIGVVLYCESMKNLREVENKLIEKGFSPKATTEDAKKIISFEVESNDPKDFESI
jgi:hypothetical protein